MSKACDITGIVAVACARHGCFAPNSIVNLFRGEQQKNVDFSFLQALKTTSVDTKQGAMLVYDLICQYFVYFKERIGHLLPAGLDVDRAIGLFHVHGHKDKCFFRYATTFIPGTGVVAGEILESLWSSLNTMSPAMRTATLAHRAEVLDDHATDSNQKKLLALSKFVLVYFNLSLILADYTLADHYWQASEMLVEAEKYFGEMSMGINHGDLKKWEVDITQAEIQRGNDVAAMDIMAARDRSPVVRFPALQHNSFDNWVQRALDIEEKQCAMVH
jgi:hypothetical protein